jgi:hypothetical protein
MASNNEYEQQRLWLDKIDDIVYDLKDETSVIRRIAKYQELYDIIKCRLEEDMRKVWKATLNNQK